MEIRIGSFNMNNFGGSSNKDFGKIAEIIVEENLDVVALQEIFSEGRGVSRLLEQNVKYELYNWDYCFAAPSESRDITKMEDMVVKKTRSEGYAFLWKKAASKKLSFLNWAKRDDLSPESSIPYQKTSVWIVPFLPGLRTTSDCSRSTAVFSSCG